MKIFPDLKLMVTSINYENEWDWNCDGGMMKEASALCIYIYRYIYSNYYLLVQEPCIYYKFIWLLSWSRAKFIFVLWPNHHRFSKFHLSHHFNYILYSNYSDSLNDQKIRILKSRYVHYKLHSTLSSNIWLVYCSLPF